MAGSPRVYLLSVSSSDDPHHHIRASLRAVDEEQVTHFAGFDALSRHLRTLALAVSLSRRGPEAGDDRSAAR